MSRALLLEKLIRLTHLTYRRRSPNWERARRETEEGGIFLVWHCFIWPLVHFFTLRAREEGISFVTLASMSDDGQLITDVLHRFDWRVVRGSSSRGAIQSLRKLLNELAEERRVFITPDGPKGPPREIKPGPVLLQRKSELPMIPVGTAVNRAYTFSSWDEFRLPWPGSKISIYFGQPITELADYGKEEACRYVETRMEQAHEQAAKLLEQTS